MSKKDDSKKVALSKYANSIRTRATEVGDDKYLLAIADRIEQGGNTLAGSIDLAIQTRLELLQLLTREVELSTAKVADTVNNSEEIKKLHESFLQLNDRVTILYTTFVTIADALAWNIGISGDMLDRMNAARADIQKKQTENEAVPDIPEPLPEEDSNVDDVLPEGVEEFTPEEPAESDTEDSEL